MAKKKNNWIKSAIGKKGALRATAKRRGLLKGKNAKLSKSDLATLAHSKNKKTAARARLAMTLRKF